MITKLLPPRALRFVHSRKCNRNVVNINIRVNATTKLVKRAKERQPSFFYSTYIHLRPFFFCQHICSRNFHAESRTPPLSFAVAMLSLLPHNRLLALNHLSKKKVNEPNPNHNSHQPPKPSKPGPHSALTITITASMWLRLADYFSRRLLSPKSAHNFPYFVDQKIGIHVIHSFLVH